MKDIKIFVCSHGKFCEELIKSAEMIAGKVENVFAFPLLQGMPPEDYKMLLEEELKKGPSKVLCLVDLFGGTPCNTCAILSKTYDMEAITGLNLAMYLEVTSQMMQVPFEELKEIGICTLQESGKDVLKILKER
ncbi:PTS sugar transporter subunit IIA [Amedibacillus sp. YH-ame10]